MCFSEEASFTSAAVIGTIGIITVLKSTRSLFFLSLIPIVLAIQQFSEGIIWRYLEQTSIHHQSYAIAAKNVFLFFAYVFWPFWIPFSIYTAETNPSKKGILLVNLAAGMILSLILLFGFLYYEHILLVVNHSLKYDSASKTWGLKFYYITVILFPCFVSSLRYIWIFGALLAISIPITAYFYYATFTSVWCFFAGIISTVIFFVVNENAIPNTTKKSDLR